MSPDTALTSRDACMMMLAGSGLPAFVFVAYKTTKPTAPCLRWLLSGCTNTEHLHTHSTSNRKLSRRHARLQCNNFSWVRARHARGEGTNDRNAAAAAAVR